MLSSGSLRSFKPLTFVTLLFDDLSVGFFFVFLVLGLLTFSSADEAGVSFGVGCVGLADESYSSI